MEFVQSSSPKKPGDYTRPDNNMGQRVSEFNQRSIVDEINRGMKRLTPTRPLDERQQPSPDDIRNVPGASRPHTPVDQGVVKMTGDSPPSAKKVTPKRRRSSSDEESPSKKHKKRGENPYSRAYSKPLGSVGGNLSFSSGAFEGIAEMPPPSVSRRAGALLNLLRNEDRVSFFMGEDALAKKSPGDPFYHLVAFNGHFKLTKDVLGTDLFNFLINEKVPKVEMGGKLMIQNVPQKILNALKTSENVEEVMRKLSFYRHGGKVGTEDGKEVDMYFELDLNRRKVGPSKKEDDELCAFRRRILGRGAYSIQVLAGALIDLNTLDSVSTAVKFFNLATSDQVQLFEQEVTLENVSGANRRLAKGAKFSRQYSSKGFAITVRGTQDKERFTKDGLNFEEIGALFTALYKYNHLGGRTNRDLKWQNVVFRKEQSRVIAEIIDRGLEVLQGDPMDYSMFVGTPFTMSPEVLGKYSPDITEIPDVDNENHKLGFDRVDVWALGGMLFRSISSLNGQQSKAYYNEYKAGGTFFEKWQRGPIPRAQLTRESLLMNVIEMSDIETNPILDSRELSDDSKTVLVMLAKMLSPQPKDRPSMSDIIEDSEFMSILQLPEKMRAVQSNILDLNRSLGGVFGTIPRFELPMRGRSKTICTKGEGPKVFW